MPEPLTGHHPPLTVSFASEKQESPYSFQVGLPILAGNEIETIFPSVKTAGVNAGYSMYEGGGWLLGCRRQPASPDMESQVFSAYLALLDACGNHQLCRIWNYVPGINSRASNGLEIYRAFSRGRARAFEEWFGPGFEHNLPSASAVGADDDQFVIHFAASENKPTHFENPQQTPAYKYPAEHGPRSPSFARASVVPRNDGRLDVFISGTAAIRGHKTQAPGNTAGQLECTLENLREISQVCGLGTGLAGDRALARHFKVYLRNAEDLAHVSASLEDRLTTATDRVTYLRADICRAALTLEIEATIIGADPV